MLGGLCSGCGSRLGWKKYKFRGLWRIPGIYCKDCMLKVGRNFEEAEGGIPTLPRFKCSTCKNEFFFTKSVKSGNTFELYCSFCYDMMNGGAQISSADNSPRTPLPRSNILVGIVGLVLLVGGLIFSFLIIREEGANLLTFLVGTGTSIVGFIIFRKALLSNRLLYGK
jgi:hypothetical protein